MSVTATEPPQRTTLLGKPIEYKHDHFTNMMNDASMTGAGANLLPPGFTDNSLVSIPIKMSDLEDQPEIPQRKRTRSFLEKVSKGLAHVTNQDIKVVQMSRGDYLKYWVKGEDGKYLSTVQEPPEGRKEFVKKHLRLTEERKEKQLAMEHARREYDASL